MGNIKNVRKIEQIESKSKVGDLPSAAYIMGITVDAARTRPNRGKDDVVEVMERIISERECLAKECQSY